MNLQQFTALKERAEKAEAERHRIEGAQKQTLAELRKRFGCKTLEEGEALLARLKRELAAKEREYDKAEREWEKKWSRNLGNGSTD